jgi:glycosyltransferase involved in cell wall biosynthesis
MNEVVDKRIALLIPAYNEEASLDQVLSASKQYIAHIIVIDDGSNDKTGAIAQQHGVDLVVNERNCGKGACLLRGLSYAFAQGWEHVVTMDADGQHDPADLERLLRLCQQERQSVLTAARVLSVQNTPRMRLWANKVADFFISWAAGTRLLDTQSGFRVYPQGVGKLMDKAKVGAEGFTFESEVLIEMAWSGVSFASIKIESIYRDDARQSYYRPGKDTWLITKMVFKKLIRKKFHLKGLYQALFGRHQAFIELN